VNDPDFFDVVRILSSPEAVSMGVDNELGIVVGISGDPDSRHYAVLAHGETFMLSAHSLERTGERVDRNTVYEGQSIRVAPQRYADDKQDPPTPKD
jgi:hypothetical protein